MGVEGLDLIPQLIISDTNDRMVQVTLLMDQDVTSCVEVSASSNTGRISVSNDLVSCCFTGVLNLACAGRFGWP